MAEYDNLIEELLSGPYRILDILPERVPEDAGDRYFAAADYFCAPARLRRLYRKFAEVLLKMNCYSSMLVSFDTGETFEKDPDPEAFAARTEDLHAGLLRVLFGKEAVMIDLDAGDTYMTVYGNGDPSFTELLRRIAEAEGLFLW